MVRNTHTTARRTAITVPKHARAVSLQANSVADGRGEDRGSVNAYTEAGHTLKEAFLRDGKSYLRAVGYALAACGFTEMAVDMNRAGIAVSGEVMAEYWHPDLAVWLYVQLSSIPLLMSGQEQRADGLTLLARTREQRGSRVVEGINRFFAPGDSVRMAHALLQLVGLEAPVPETSIPGGRGKEAREAPAEQLVLFA